MDELQAEEYKDFKENAQLKAIIAGQQAKNISIDINGIEIKIRAAIPKGTRDRIGSIVKQYEAGEISEADEEMYNVMASISLTEPFNVPATWKYIDEETGEVPNLMKMMIEKMTDLEGTAARFRRQR